jgi:hypothetical protein
VQTVGAAGWTHIQYEVVDLLCADATDVLLAGPPVPPSATSSRQHSSVLSPRASAGGAELDADAANDWGVEVTEEDRAVWAAQEAMAERLPMVRAI